MIYLDNAATTQMDSDLIEIYKEWAVDNFFNPSAIYKPSLLVKNKINEARENILKLLSANNYKLVFLSSGTEGDNMALSSFLKRRGSVIVISEREHSAVYEMAMELKARGHQIRIAPCDRYGEIDYDKLESILDDDVELVSIMHVNNESGAINNLKRIKDIIKLKCKRAIFHSDGVQALAKINVNLSELGVDIYTISAHKIRGPKGLGAIIFRNNLNPKPLIFGGGQEMGYRSATENVASILAFALALSKAVANLNNNYKIMQSLKQKIYNALDSEGIEYINLSAESASPYVVSIALKLFRGEIALHALEEKEIYIATGSACTSNKKDDRLLKATRLDREYREGILRISPSIYTKEEDIHQFAKELKIIINKYIGRR